MNPIEPIKTQIALDTELIQPQLTIPLRQGETARELCFTLLTDGEEYILSENEYAIFTGLKADGKLVFNRCDMVDDSIIYPLSPQTTAVSGLMLCQLRIYGEDDALLLSPRFVMDIEPSVYTDDAIIESQNEVTALTALISESTGLIDKIRQDLEQGAYIPRLKIGTVSTLPTGAMATASITGTGSEPVLNLGIPQGPEGQAEHLIPDAELDENSLKPPQNRAVTLAMAKKLDKSEFELSRANFVEKEEFSETLSNFVEMEEFGNEMSKKVDKVSGKGLSSYDFTAAYKTKLDGIEAGANKFAIADSSISRAKLSQDAKSRAYTATLSATGWSGNAQAVSLSAVSADNNVIVAPSPDSAEAYADSEIKCIAQAAGKLTFSCASQPSAAVSVQVLVLP